MVSSDKLQRGFTIVELLIVIVVIGILAAVTIVAYNGIQNRAQQATFISDFSNAAKMAEIFYNDPTTSGVYPNSATTITQAGIKLTKGSYNAAVWCFPNDRSGWALVADNKDGKTYYISNTQRTMTEYTLNKVQGQSGGTTCPGVSSNAMGNWIWLVQCPTCAWAI